MTQFSEIRESKLGAHDPDPFPIPISFPFHIVNLKLEKVGLVEEPRIGILNQNDPQGIGTIVEQVRGDLTALANQPRGETLRLGTGIEDTDPLKVLEDEADLEKGVGEIGPVVDLDREGILDGQALRVDRRSRAEADGKQPHRG